MHWTKTKTPEEVKEILAHRSATRRVNNPLKVLPDRICELESCKKQYTPWPNNPSQRFCSPLCARKGGHWTTGKSEEEVSQIYSEIGKKRRTHYHPDGIPRSFEVIDKMRATVALTGGNKRPRNRAFMKTPEYRAKVVAGEARMQENIHKIAEHFRADGWEAVEIDKMVQPDIIAKKDGKLIAIEVESGHSWANVFKYKEPKFFDDVIWAVWSERAERKLIYQGLKPMRINF